MSDLTKFTRDEVYQSMSKRQPTIEIDDDIIAHDEIAEIIELNELSTSARDRKQSPVKAVRLVNRTIVPLSAQKIDDVINFLRQNEY
jgi:hypothetical protein